MDSETDKSQIFSPIDDVSSIEHMSDPIRTFWDVANENWPVMQGKGTTFGGIELPNYYGNFGERDGVAVFSFEHAMEVLGNPKVFSNDYWQDTNERVQGRSLFCMDPPEHTRFRRLIQRGFSPRVVNAWDEDIIKPEIDAAFARIVGNGKGDIVEELNLTFPYRIICRILGFPTTDEEYISDNVTKMTRGVYDMESALTAVSNLREYIEPHLKARKADPKDDFLSALVSGSVDGSELSDDEIVRFILHLYPAGMETTFRGVSNLMHLLLSHPEQFAALKNDRSLIGPAIEEMLRYEGPVSMFARLVKEDAKIGDIEVKAGTMTYVMHAIANRDPNRWKNPHSFNISRAKKGNLGFGAGPHVCIGMHLAKRETEIYMNNMLDQMPDIRWDSELEAPPLISGWTLRSALSLPVEWD